MRRRGEAAKKRDREVADVAVVDAHGAVLENLDAIELEGELPNLVLGGPGMG